MLPFPTALFTSIQQYTPFQPATNFWRAIEISFLIENGLPALKKAINILDLGCGDGGVMRLIKPHLPQGAFLTGLDPDWQEIALAAQTGLYDKLLARAGHETELPDASQDAIISNSVLEHIPNLDAVLAECARILKPGGVFIATVPGPDFHACLKGPRFGRERYLKALDERLAHEHYLSAEEWASEMEQAGLTLAQSLPYLTRAQTRRWELLSNMTGGLLHRVSGGKKPILLQRALHLRETKRMPPWAADRLARLITAGLHEERQEQFSCLLLVGGKP